MRSAHELTFRARQEFTNLHLLLRPPTLQPGHVPYIALPDADAVVARLQSSQFRRNVVELADAILRHHIPIGGTIVETGPQVHWRRDYRHGQESGLSYFRFTPYLQFNVVGDHKAIWDLNRHQHLVVLAQACLFTGRDEYRDEIERQLDSWFADNPFLRGINWTSALEVAFRALSWTWILHLIGPRLSEPLRARLLNCLYQHGAFLEANLSIYFSPNTHLLGEAVALHALGALFPEFPPATRWREHGDAVVADQLKTQVREDGSHFEQSSYYHVYALDLFLFHAILSHPAAAYRATLSRMADYLDALMGTIRTLPLMGDDDGGRLFHPYGPCDRFGRATLATCAVLLDEPSWLKSSEDLHEQAAWWLGVPSLEPQPSAQQTPRGSRLFADSGMAIMAAGPVQVLFDAGSFGRGSAGHSHSDALNIVIRNGESEVLIDPGTFTYVSDPSMRAWFRGSTAHNVVVVDGHDQATSAGPFRWLDCADVHLARWYSGDDHDFVDARWQQTASPTVAHQRQMMLLKQCDWAAAAILIVRDTIDGQSVDCGVEQLWHPGDEVTRTGPDHIVIGRQNHLLVPDGGGLQGAEGWRSRCFGEKTSVPVLAIRYRGRPPLVMWTALIMSGQGDFRVPVRLIASGRTAAIHWNDAAKITVNFSEDREASYKLDRS